MDEIHENAHSKISLVLVGNKSDAIDQRLVNAEDAKMFAAKNKMEYVETSAKTGFNVSEAFEKATAMIYNKVLNGIIDATQESSGVRLGTDIKVDKKSVQKLNYSEEKRENPACAC